MLLEIINVQSIALAVLSDASKAESLACSENAALKNSALKNSALKNGNQIFFVESVRIAYRQCYLCYSEPDSLYCFPQAGI